MNQADREFSLINSIVGRSVAGHTRAGLCRPGFRLHGRQRTVPAPAPRPPQNAYFREKFQPLALTAPSPPNPKGSSPVTFP